LTTNPLEPLLHDLPPTPAVLPRLLTLLSDLNSSPAEVVELVSLDPGLAASILRASRSAFYGSRSQHVENLDEALAELGFKEVYRLVSLFVLSEAAREPLVLYGLTPEAFWRKSVACALAMETLCGEMGAPGATGYTIGLLHAVGETFVNRLAHLQAPKGRPLVAFARPLPMAEQELAVAGITQTEAAACAMRHWRFPDAVVEPIEFQFRPHEAPTYTQMALRLRLGKWLTHLVLGDEATAQAVNPEFHFAISVPGNSFARMVEDLRHRLGEAADALHGTGCAVA
jgi:HD-like signal output (HDOD) protein